MVKLQLGRPYAAFMAAFFCVSFSTGCSTEIEIDKLSGHTMGTSWSVVISSPIALHDRIELQSEIESVLATVSKEMSTYDPTSVISTFNRSRELNTWFFVSDRFALMAETALKFFEISGGAFDPTVGPLVNLWGFGSVDGTDVLPRSSQINIAKAGVGFEAIHIRNSASGSAAALQKSAHRELDFSAIAKGFGVDEVFYLLENKGYRDYLVEIGGEVRVKGNKNGLGWRIALEKPTRDSRSVEQVLTLSDVAVATSGDYRNYREIDGVAYSHIIDPSTGWPVTHHLASVTVADTNCLMADGWATTLLVLGPEAGYAMAIEKQLAALFIERDGKRFIVKQTPHFLQLGTGESE